MFDFIKNKTVFANKYHTHSEAVIISCFFNPQNSYYRLKAFKLFYESIKHLNYRIVECVIGDSKSQLSSLNDPNISIVYTDNLLWHKETLLNNLVTTLPKKFKYVFWVDADVIFTNKKWLVEGVEELEQVNIIQPFEYCVHLEKNESDPSFDIVNATIGSLPNRKNPKVWKSFMSNCAQHKHWQDENYNNHGHVGFAWGARREVLEACPLYDRALIGGADHIIAHAAAGQIGHSCITKSFTENLDEVNEWSKKFYRAVSNRVGYVRGNLYHIWHGDIEKREYLKRIQDFTPKTKTITKRDKNGLHVTEDDTYMWDYFNRRELIGTFVDFETKSSEEFLNNGADSFGGGNFGGGGAGGDWMPDVQSETKDTTAAEVGVLSAIEASQQENNPFS